MESKRVIAGAGHGCNVSRKPLPAKWPCEDAWDLVCNIVKVEGGWMPAKPLPGPWRREMKRRIAAAWLVLRGEAAAVRWK